MTKRTQIVWEYILIACMGILFALDNCLFIVPNGFAPSGINGIAVMVQYKFGFSVGYLSMLINVPLCIAAFCTGERRFAVRTLFFCLAYSFSYLAMDGSSWIGAFQYNANNVDTIYPVIMSGLIAGFVFGMLFRYSASSGGTDVIAKMAVRKNPNLNFFWSTFALNALVAFASYFVYAREVDGVMVYDFKPVCLCMFYSFLSSFVGSRMLKESKSACEFTVITSHPREIEQEVTQKLHHSITEIKGTGVFSGQEKTILLCLINKHQRTEFESIVSRYPETFSIEKSVRSVVGNFKRNVK